MENKIFVVCDRNVEEFARNLAPDRPLLAICADEEHKTMDTVVSICRWLLEQGADRKAVVYAVGGGVTTDMVGFAASIYKRGVRYINYPTTLLCQVDAGVGGKTGVNLDGYKNMMGVTRFPAATRILPDSLKTLPLRELRSGAAELLKTFIIGDAGSYKKAVNLLSAPEIDFSALHKLVIEAAEIKHRIVTKDPYEENLRRVLNLGHSYGHAIEWYQHSKDGAGNESTGRQSPYTHGEAVAIGIIRAAELSEACHIASPGLADRLRADFQACGLPVDLPCPEEELRKALWRDKKVEGSKIHFVFIKKIGKVVVEETDQAFFDKYQIR